jgi:hypothetical protein
LHPFATLFAVLCGIFLLTIGSQRRSFPAARSSRITAHQSASKILIFGAHHSRNVLAVVTKPEQRATDNRR